MSDSVAPWPVTHQAPLPMEYFRQEYWRGMQSPSLGDLPDPRDEPGSLASPALADGSLSLAPPGKPITHPETVIKNVNNIKAIILRGWRTNKGRIMARKEADWV